MLGRVGFRNGQVSWGLGRHGRCGQARIVGQDTARWGEARRGTAGQVGSGKARCVAFFWDWVRHGRSGQAGRGSSRQGKARQVWHGGVRLFEVGWDEVGRGPVWQVWFVEMWRVGLVLVLARSA